MSGWGFHVWAVGFGVFKTQDGYVWSETLGIEQTILLSEIFTIASSGDDGSGTHETPVMK